MSYKRRSESKLTKITEGFLEKAVDAVLVGIFFNLEFPQYAKTQRWKLEGKIHEDLEKVNYQTIKRAFNYLQRKGLIQTGRETLALPKITEEGKKRIGSLLPHYDEKRVWDGRLYLVTYDLPVKRNSERNYLRVFLKKIGCGMLQQSVWITPYNPADLLAKIVEERNLTDLILVSSLGRDGTIGGMELPNLTERVYHLSEINERYREFLLESKEGKLNRDQLIFRYISILDDDPQLPFELLPEDWKGEEAYNIYKKTSRIHEIRQI